LLVDVNPMINTAVIELMLQLPGLDKDMIVNVRIIFYNLMYNFYEWYKIEISQLSLYNLHVMRSP